MPSTRRSATSRTSNGKTPGRTRCHPSGVHAGSPYEPLLIERLRADPAEASAYLQASFADGDPRVFLLALRVVAEAYGGVRALAVRTGLNRETLYRTLSRRGNPSLTTLTAILQAMGLTLTICPKNPRNDA